MAFSFSPKVVTNGLVLALDAANAKSYPGSGTTWGDLSGNNNNGTLTNGPTYSSANGGSIVFDGTNDYVASFNNQLIGIGSKTISCFVYPTSTNRIGICGIRTSSGIGVDIIGWAFTLNRTSAGDLTYYHTGGSLIEINANAIINNWYHFCVTYSTSTATAILYKNGTQLGSPQTSFSVANSSTFNGVIGDEDNTYTTPFKGNISNIQIYNRALSAQEVLQNYNATKGRFGLT